MKIELEINDEALFAQLGPKFMEFVQKHAGTGSDPLLTCEQAGKRLGLSRTTVRQLVTTGKLRRAPGLVDIRIRQSVVDQYAK